MSFRVDVLNDERFSIERWRCTMIGDHARAVGMMRRSRSHDAVGLTALEGPGSDLYGSMGALLAVIGMGPLVVVIGMGGWR